MSQNLERKNKYSCAHKIKFEWIKKKGMKKYYNKSYMFFGYLYVKKEMKNFYFQK